MLRYTVMRKSTLILALLSLFGCSSTPQVGSASVTSASLVGDEAIIGWTNTGQSPIERVKANIRAYDAEGKLTYEAKDYDIFASEASEGTSPVPPGGTYADAPGMGHKIAEVNAGPPVKIEAEITYAGDGPAE